MSSIFDSEEKILNEAEKYIFENQYADMEKFKDYIAKKLIGERLHFKCDCLLGLDHVGRIVDYEIVANEIIFIVDVDSRIIRVGENHPNMYIENVS